MVPINSSITYTNNFEDSLGLIDLFHQNQQIAFEVQSLI
jgi:hypothetical protein